MTGFGSATIDNENYRIVVELKTINHRFSDIYLKLPKEISKFEIEIRQAIKSRLLRGKLDATVQIQYQGVSDRLTVNHDLLDNYIALAQDISNKYFIDKINNPIDLIRLPNIVIENDEINSSENLKIDILKAINLAIDNLDEARLLEGEHLKNDILSKVDEIERIVNLIENNGDKFIAEYRKKLRKNIEDLISDRNISEERIVIEAGILADRLCIDEELVRLHSHINQTKEILNGNFDEVGRKLDFILQEFNRESNTILSKSVDIDIVNKGLELKYIIEKIREQVQNLI